MCGHREFLPILQNFVSYRGRCPKKVTNLLPRPFGEFLLPRGNFIGSDVSPVLILMYEDEGWGFDGGGCGGGGGGDRPGVSGVQECDVDDIQLFHSDIERL